MTSPINKRISYELLYRNFIEISRKFVSRFPSYLWYTCYPQLVSRISHPNTEIFENLQVSGLYLLHTYFTHLFQAILLKVLNDYPNQALWSVVAITQHKQKERNERAQAVLAKINARHHTLKSQVCNKMKSWYFIFSRLRVCSKIYWIYVITISQKILRK